MSQKILYRGIIINPEYVVECSQEYTHSLDGDILHYSIRIDYDNANQLQRFFHFEKKEDRDEAYLQLQNLLNVKDN